MTDAERLLFAIFAPLVALAFAVFLALLAWHLLVWFLNRHAGWSLFGDWLADRRWGRGRWRYPGG